MKGFKYIVIIGIILWIGSTVAVILPLKNSIELKKDLISKEKDLERGVNANKEIGRIQKNVFNQKLETLIIEEKIPKNEKSQVDLIKMLSSVAQKAGFQNIAFTIEKNKKSQDDMFMGNISLSNGGSGTVSDDFSSFSENGGQSDSGGGNVSLVEPSIFILEGEIKSQLIFSFLEEVLNLKRLITIESIEIEQSSEISPRQKVKITLVSYSFLN